MENVRDNSLRSVAIVRLKCGVALWVVLSLTLHVAAGAAEVKPPAVEEALQKAQRLAKEIETLRDKMNAAQKAGHPQSAKELAGQMRKAQKAEQDFQLQLKEKWRAARNAGRIEEAKQLGRLFEEAVRHGEYARSLRASRPKPAPFDVVFSEVCYWPKKAENEWVELTNVSEKPVDISGWAIMDGQSLTFTLPDNTPAVPPGGCVVILFDGAGVPHVAREKEIVIHTPRELNGNVLGDKGGHLALYAPGERGLEPGISTLRSYVAWGWSPGTILADAIASKHWARISDIPPSTSPVTIHGPMKWHQQGGSIGLVAPHEDVGRGKNSWGVFAPDEASPGESNNSDKKRSPVLHLPADGSGTGDDGIITLSCTRLEKGVRYHFQVCWDEECTKVFLDAPDLDGPRYRLAKPVPKGKTVYWRARAIYPDGSASQWSHRRRLLHRD